MTEPTHGTTRCPECGTAVDVDRGPTPAFRPECPDCGAGATGRSRTHQNEPTWRRTHPPDADRTAE